MSDHDENGRKGRPTVAFAEGDTLGELIYDAQSRATGFAVWSDEQWTIERHIETPNGERLVPFSPSNNLIRHEAVLLPSSPQEYGTRDDLLSEVQGFLHRYVDFTDTFEKVAAHYVLLTWVHDVFNELPYLRLRGDFGTGKTRALLAIGSLCNKAFFASGASTVSPIFHTLDAFGGTLILDEADFRFSDERAEIVKILNNGNVRGLPVLRTMISQKREFNPQAFRVFGPKIVATRGNYEDKGLESRFLTEDMGGRRLRGDIPINLPSDFRAEALELRNKLLLYRFRCRSQVALDDSLLDPALEPRSNQILLPLLSLVQDSALRSEVRAAALHAQESTAAERGLYPEAHVLEVLADRLPSESLGVSVAEIAAHMVERHAAEYERPITNRWIGSLLRNRLHLRTYKSHGIYMVPVSERPKVEQLCTRYGVSLRKRNSTVQLGDVGTSGT